MLRSVCVSRADVACKSHADSLSTLSQQPAYIPASILTAVFQMNLGKPVSLLFLPPLVLEENIWG